MLHNNITKNQELSTLIWYLLQYSSSLLLLAHGTFLCVLLLAIGYQQNSIKPAAPRACMCYARVLYKQNVDPS